MGMGAWASMYEGDKMYKEGKRLAAETVRPEYEIPPEIAQNLTQAKLRALEGLPAATKQAYVQNIQRSTMTGMEGLQDRGTAVSGASAMLQGEQDAYLKLMGADATTRMEAEGDLGDARLTSARYKDRKFDVNEMQPYEVDYMRAQELMTAGVEYKTSGATQESSDMKSMFSFGMAG